MKDTQHNNDIAQQPFERGDWVLYDRRMAFVIRLCYKDYAGKCRIARPDEDHRHWAAGWWHFCAAISPLRLPARFSINGHSVTTAEDPPREILPGLVGILRRFDEDGDLLVEFEGHPWLYPIYSKDAGALLFDR